MSILLSAIGNNGADLQSPLKLEFDNSAPAVVAVGAKTSQNVFIQWGDGTSTNVTMPGIYTHEYPATPGSTYVCSVHGGLVELGYDPADVRLDPILQSQLENPALLSVVDFGNLNSFTTARFQYAVNLVSVPDTLSPYFTSLNGMFMGCSLFNDTNVAAWDVSMVTDMSYTFYDCISFSVGAIAGWDVSAVTNMDAMFYNAWNFVDDLSGWCVTNIATEPTDFATGAATFDHPVWGTCPGNCSTYWGSTVLQLDFSNAMDGSTATPDQSSTGRTPDFISNVSVDDGALRAYGGYLSYSRSPSFSPNEPFFYEGYLTLDPGASGYALSFSSGAYATIGAQGITFSGLGSYTTPRGPVFDSEDLGITLGQEFHFLFQRNADGSAFATVDGVTSYQWAALNDLSSLEEFSIFGLPSRTDVSATGMKVRAFRYVIGEAPFLAPFTPTPLPFPQEACPIPPATCFEAYHLVSVQLVAGPSPTDFTDEGPFALVPTVSDAAVVAGYAESTGATPSVAFASNPLFAMTGTRTVEFFLTIDETSPDTRTFAAFGDKYFYVEPDSTRLRSQGFSAYGTNFDDPTTMSPLVLGQEYHIRLVMGNAVATAYVNGLMSSSGTVSAADKNPRAFDLMGASGEVRFSGMRIRGFRFTRALVNTAAFTPPSLPFPTVACVPLCFDDYNAVALQILDGSDPDGTVFADYGPSALTPSSQVNVEIENTYGQSTDAASWWPQLRYADSTQFNNSGPFTLQFKLTILDVAPYFRWFCAKDTNVSFYLQYDSTLQAIGWFGGSVTINFPPLANGVEHEICISSDGSTGYHFLDGELLGTTPGLFGLDTGAVPFDPFIALGQRGLFNAKMRGLRFTRACLYTENYIPAPLPYPTTSCTMPS